MKRRLLSALLALCMVTAMAPMAFAVDAGAPSAASISIDGEDGTPYTSHEDGAALRMDIPNDVVLDIASIGMVTTEEVELGNVSGAGANTVYADGENLKISLNVKGVPYTVTAQMNTTDNINWTGEGDVPDIEGVTDLPIGALANELGDTDISVAEGVLVAGDRQSVAAKVHINQDAEKVYLYLYPASVNEYTLTYTISGTTYTFTQPEGSAKVAPAVTVAPNTTLVWYADEDYTTVATIDGAVTANQAFYGRFETSGEVEEDSFADQLEDDTLSTLTIRNAEDFSTFAARADEVAADQVVELDANLTTLNLGNTTYTAISGFKGDFNGNNVTIANATFTAAGGNAGMFATLGSGQVVANLGLDNITVNQSGATYSGTLVGSASGVESSGSGQVTIQNVQVSNSTVRGRSAGGIAGFILWTDVKYCSVTGDDNMDITGTVNAGGIVGISYNNISDCYVIATPDTTLPFLNDIGGIVGKNLDNAAHITHCWTTYDAIVGHTDNPDIVTDYIEAVNRGTEASDFRALGFDEVYWVLADGTGSHFTGAVQYEFA